MSAQIYLNQLVHMSSMLDFSGMSWVCWFTLLSRNAIQRKWKGTSQLQIIKTHCVGVWQGLWKRLDDCKTALFVMVNHAFMRCRRNGKHRKTASYSVIVVRMEIRFVCTNMHLQCFINNSANRLQGAFVFWVVFLSCFMFFCAHFAAVCQHICSFFKVWVKHGLEFLDVDPSFSKPNMMVWLKPDKCYQKHLHYYFHEIDWWLRWPSVTALPVTGFTSTPLGNKSTLWMEF